jgi:hypothetical protein
MQCGFVVGARKWQLRQLPDNRRNLPRVAKA